MKDKRGVIYLETLIAFLPVFAFFLGTLQLADISVAHLIVQHASSTAARAAAVVLPDDGAYYEDRQNEQLHQFTGGRRVDIERAADLILRANPRLHLDGPNVSLDKGSYADRDDLTATVRARYRCLIPPLCGSGHDLSAESKLVYQGAQFVYEPMTLGDIPFNRGRQDTERSISDSSDPRKDERAGDPLFASNEPASRADNARPPRATPPDPRAAGSQNGADATNKPGAAVGPASPRGPPVELTRPSDAVSPPVVADTPPGQAGRPVDLTKPAPTREQPVATALTPKEIEEALRRAGGCFVAGTGIDTPEGVRAIETIATGDVVYARDDSEQKVVASTVTSTFVRKTSAVVDLTVRVADNERDEQITGTANHPFYLPEVDEYQPMAMLTPGAELLTLEGRRAYVVSLQLREGDFEVFNFTVEGQHNYYVLGSNDPPSGILVHNQTNPCGQAGGNDPPYDGRAIRDHFEATYGPGNVRSSTIPPRNAPNVRLAGTRHPTGVVFDEKGYPIFDDFAVADLRISDAHVASNNDQTQMRAATRQLRDMIKNDPILRAKFTPAELRAIASGRAKIPGYTWQHHQDVGRMQLVPEAIHSAVGHIGGSAMWTGR